MLTKHEALMADIESYNTVIQGLREQSQECKVSIFSTELYILHILVKDV